MADVVARGDALAALPVRWIFLPGGAVIARVHARTDPVQRVEVPQRISVVLMRRSFLILDTYYPAFIQRLYQEYPSLQASSYTEQKQHLLRRRFGTFDSYSFYLQRLGHEADEVLANVPQVQRAWANENSRRLAILGTLAQSLRREQAWLHAVMFRQIKMVRPDVLLTQDMNWLDGEFLRAIRPFVGVIVGQIASSLRQDAELDEYDLVLSSFPHFVEEFRQQGLRSEYFQLGFDPRLLHEVEAVEDRYSVTFVGGFSAAHSETPGMKAITHLASCRPVNVWGYGMDSIPADSPLRRSYQGEAWGLQMFSILGASEVTLNRHIDVSRGYANNMRLYEATGMGACLVTDGQRNLSDIFEPDEEVIPYSSPADLVEKVERLLQDSRWRREVARAGQQRTLREHTYRHRMEQLAHLVEDLFAAGAA